MSANPNRRVVITGMGAVTNIGMNVPAFWDALIQGKSGISRITSFEQDDQWTVNIAGEVHNFKPAETLDHREMKRMDRVCAFGMCAAEEAAIDCGMDFSQGDPYRRGVVIGSGIGGIMTIESGHEKLIKHGPRKISPFTVPKLMVNACAGNVSIRHNLRGVNSVTSTACATGAHAIGTGYELIAVGAADLVFAGGSEASVSPLCLAAFAAMKALSVRNDDPILASRPFDRDRDGFVLGEGAGVVVLEDLESARKRGAKIYAEVLSFASSGDAYHIAAPEPDGTGAQAAMRSGVSSANLQPTDIDLINAHGTSTPLGDTAEVNAIRNYFGDHTPALSITSSKSMTGHTLGAAGGIESVATVLSIYHQQATPTINCVNPDEGWEDLDFVPEKAKSREIRYALNNSFGFGGHNACLVFGRYDGD